MKIFLTVITFAVLFLPLGIASAVSIAPEVIKQLEDSGQLQSIVNADREARTRGVWQPNQNPYRMGVTTDVDTLHCLIILVDFTDMTHEAGLHTEPADFDTLLFSRDNWEPGSMTDYYWETSYNQALLIGQVTNWYRMPETYAYYVDGQRGFGNYPRNAQRLTEDAVMAADIDVDFSEYDNNGDGWVDALFVVHAGPGYEDTGNLNYIHSHAWSISHPIDLDGVQVSGYSMEPEETGGHNLVTIGVYCHEFGHVLGLPDLYDYDYDSDGVGVWSVMAGGSWGGGGATPVHFDGWSKCQLGWVMAAEPMDNLTNEQIDAVEYNQDIYILYSRGEYDIQYFLVENRRQELFDVSLPGSGLVIYHVDESMPNNNDQTHFKVAVEQADGEFDLENNRGGDSSDPWPGMTDNRNFDDFSTPNSHLYGGIISEVGVYNISDSDSVMHADLQVLFSEPFYELLSVDFDDSNGNGNGRPEAGELCKLVFSAQNIRAMVDNFAVTASCSDSLLTFTDSVSNFGSIPVNEPFDNLADPIWFTLPSGYSSRFVYFTLTFSAMSGGFTQQISSRELLGIPQLLLVDDDDGAQIDTFYTIALDSIGMAYEHWDVSTQGSPVLVMANYDYAIWFTGNSRTGPLSTDDVEVLISYLNGGGRLVISSQDIVQRLYERGSARDSLLLNQYLKLAYNLRENDHRPSGVWGSPFDTLAFYTIGAGGANNQTSQDSYNMLEGGTLIMTYRTGRTAAVMVNGSYLAMTFGFGAEALNSDFPTLYASRQTFFDRLIDYLTQETAIDNDVITLPSMTSLEQNYPNPFNPATTISFNLAKAGEAELTIFDITGRMIDQPLKSYLGVGRHELSWNGSERASGIYFYMLVTPETIQTRRMTLVK